MSSEAPEGKTRRTRLAVVISILAVIALVGLFFLFAGFYADFLWFDQLGFVGVLTTQWVSLLVLFAMGFVAMAGPVWATMAITHRVRPVYASLDSQFDRYRQAIQPLARFFAWGIPIVFGLFAGLVAGSRWQPILLWLNRTPTGQTDPQFGFDISFFLFDFPVYHGLVAFVSAVVLVCGVIALVMHYVYGSIRVHGRELRISKAARIEIAVIGAIYLALQAVSIWLDQYSTLTEGTELGINGATYTGVNAVIPGRVILASIAALVAVLFLITAFVGRWRLPIVGTALLIVSSLLIGSAYPWVVQRFQVDPNAKALEAPYIQRAIDLTRQAYGVSAVEEIPYNATTDATQGALRTDAETTANIRIIDPALVSPSFAQLEQYRQYYQFPEHLDVDRYDINGRSQDTVLSVRELRQDGLGEARNWVNDSIVYTHGYGVVAAYGNQRAVDGSPVFLEKGIPVTGSLGSFEPRIYFGENSPTYSIVGAPEGAEAVELDYPSNSDKENNARTTFSGDGGPKLDNVFKKLIFALKFQSEQVFLSDSVTEESQILYDRNPLERVRKVAPYLTLDSDPYPAVVDGRVTWIIDGYSTSAHYPYSRLTDLRTAIKDSENPSGGQPGPLQNINYMRNSVKATVDAYDGHVTLYAWDETDPVIASWQKVFPSTVRPLSDMSGDLMSHVRYPADLFKVQRSILGQYHVADAGSFFSRDDAWQTPNDPVSDAKSPSLQPPYYLTMQVPGTSSSAFTLYSTFIPQAAGESSRNVLTGYLAADADAGRVAGQKGTDYGKLRLLTLPKADTVPGPGQVQNSFDSDPGVSQELNLLRQGQTSVLNGNLLTLPVGGGLLYVQPVYVKSTGDTSYPLLQKVLVAFGDKIAFENTLNGALDVLFGGNSGADAGDTMVPQQGTSPDAPAPPASSEPGAGSANPVGLQSALESAKKALDAKQAALRAGDWAAYGKADQELAAAIAAAVSATQ